MARITSIETYKAVLASGIINKRREEVYKALYENPHSTGNEIYQILNVNKSKSPLSQSRARFTELRDMGLIEETGKRPCKVTGRVVICYRTTDFTGRELPKEKSRKEKKNEILKNIEALGLALDSCSRTEAKDDLREIYKLVKKL